MLVPLAMGNLSFLAQQDLPPFQFQTTTLVLTMNIWELMEVDVLIYDDTNGFFSGIVNYYFDQISLKHAFNANLAAIMQSKKRL